MDQQTLARLVETVIRDQPVTDLHTHCFSPRFGHSADAASPGFMLWGIDDLLNYHYLIAELFRAPNIENLTPEQFWKLPRPQQADLIWQHLFIENTPLSEACRGVLATLSRLGLDPNERTLAPYRQWFAQQDADSFVDRVMQIANVDSITMTNDVFDDAERELWLRDPAVKEDARFPAVLRLDPMLLDWPATARRLHDWGYNVNADLSGPAVDEAKRFLHEWLDRMSAIYVAASLPPTFRYPSAKLEGEQSLGESVLERVLLPVLAERNLPLALMIGVRRGVNPALRGAGDMVGHSDVLSVVNMCAGFPQNRFMITMLSRENQYELAVAARKFNNLLPFGCWWFLNTPSLIEEITRMRLELLGPTFTFQHSDARILNQIIYKWDHSRQVLTKVLTDHYTGLAATGFVVNESVVRRDVANLLRDNFRRFVG